MRNKTILFIAPDVYRPDLPNFKSKFEMLPAGISGAIIARSSPDFDGYRLGAFLLRVVPFPEKYGVLETLKQMVSIVRRGLEVHRKTPVDLIQCYDPLKLGICAIILKKLTGAKAIIEVNGHLIDAGFLFQITISEKIKRVFYGATIRWCLKAADAVKLLNDKQLDEWKRALVNKKVFMFHDFVPTHLFRMSKSNHGYIFFAGFPFYLKGVDVLINAFKQVAAKYPDMKLVIMGHTRSDREQFQKMIQDCEAIEILKPVDYDKIISYFENCTFFVLPSRSEAMGRVLIEAMACGKAVIASNVDGIPMLVKDGENGLLFHSENVFELAAKIDLLLSDEKLRSQLGENGYASMHEKFSSKLYIKRFVEMVESVS